MAEYDLYYFGADGIYDFPAPGQPSAYPLRLFPAVVGGSALVYRMRGFDQNVAVNDIVYWDSDHVDATAADYTGSAGPVVDTVLQKKIGE